MALSSRLHSCRPPVQVRGFPASARTLRRAQILLALRRRIISAVRSDKQKPDGEMGLGLGDRQTASLFEVAERDLGAESTQEEGMTTRKMLAVDMAVKLEAHATDSNIRRQQPNTKARRASVAGASGGADGGDGGVAAEKLQRLEKGMVELRTEMQRELASLHASIESLSKAVKEGFKASGA